MISDDDLARLGEGLFRSGYTTAAVHELLGPVAHAALARGEHVPAEQVTRGGSRLETLVRLFLLGRGLHENAVAAALDPLPVDAAAAAGLVGVGFRGGTKARLDVRPYGTEHNERWVISDLGTDVRPGPLPADHVLGVGGASVTLAQAMVPMPEQVATALDLGTGCGVQALHLSERAAQITATDANPRALALARMTAKVNGLSWELLGGDLLAPVSSRRFDLVVSNPPFVVGPPDARYLYRDSGRGGDDVCATLVRGAGDVLAEGGWFQLLANWVVHDGEDWRDRVSTWCAASGCDALVVQREVQDPSEYVALWLRDAGESLGSDADDLYEQWLAWFQERSVSYVGFGLITLRRSGSDQPTITCEEARHPVDQPLGPHLRAWVERLDALRDADLLSLVLRAPESLRLDQLGALGDEGWQVSEQALRLDSGFRWRVPCDQLVADLVAGCRGGQPGALTLGEQLQLLAAAHGQEVDSLTAAALPVVRDLLSLGLLDLTPPPA